MLKMDISKKFRSVFILLGILLLLVGSEHQLIASEESQEEYNEEAVYYENFNLKRLSKAVEDEIVQDEELKYKKEYKQIGFLQRLSHRFNRLMNSIFGSGDVQDGWSTIKAILYLLVALLAVYILYRARFNHSFTEDPMRRTKMTFEEIEENLLDLNLDEKIEQAIRTGNFRIAIRLSYLKSLKLLAQKDIIEWDSNKTNGDYRYEIAGSGFEKEFESITSVFDYVWYGEFPIDKESFFDFRESFSSFYSKLN